MSSPPEGFRVQPRLASGSPRLATFFTAYPEPIGISGSVNIVIEIAQPLVGYDSLRRIVLHYNDTIAVAERPPSETKTMFVSIRFHRGTAEASRLLDETNRLFRVLQNVAPALGYHPVSHDVDSGIVHSADSEEVAEVPDFVTYTIVEMVTPLALWDGSRWRAAEPGDEVMGPTLTRCIDALCDVVNAYRLGRNIRIPVPARERLGPSVVGATRPADPSQGTWDPHADPVPRVVINMFALHREHQMPPVIGGEIYALLSGYFQMKSIRHPVLPVSELQTDAEVALNQLGDFRSAVMLAYSASEVFLDAVLAALYWEEGLTPTAAAERFLQPFLGRVRSQYHPRIGGSWDTSKRGPLGSWRANLVLVRHAVTHGGDLPTRQAADAAVEAHGEVREHTLLRLIASRRKYPLSVGILVGEQSFRRRGLWSTRNQQLVAAAEERLGEFGAWRQEVLVLRAAAG